MGLSRAVPASRRGCVELISANPRTLPTLGFAESFIEGIASPAHAKDRVTFATGRQDFAKTSYVDIDGSIGDVGGSHPNALQKLLP
jgi:hypothetical protein